MSLERLELAGVRIEPGARAVEPGEARNIIKECLPQPGGLMVRDRHARSLPNERPAIGWRVALDRILDHGEHELGVADELIGGLALLRAGRHVEAERRN